MAELVREMYSSIVPQPAQILQVPVKGDSIVPDTKPDADKILQTSVRYLPEDAVQDRKRIRLQGKLEFTVLYLSQEEVPRLQSLTALLPVEEEVNLDGIIQEDDRIRFQMAYSPENIHSTLLNGRKVSLSALLEIEVHITKYQDTSVVMDVSGEDNLVLQTVKQKMQRLIGDKEEKLVVRESAAIRESGPNIQEILWWDASILDRSCRLLEGRVQLKGTLHMSVLYQSESGVEFMERKTDFAGLIDVDGAQESMQVSAQLELVKGSVTMQADNDGEMRLIDMEVIVSGHVRVWDEEERELVIDAYDTQREVQLEKTKRPMQQMLYHDRVRVDVSDTLAIPEGMPMALQVFCTTARPKLDDVFLEDQALHIEGVLYVTAFCLTADDRSPVISFMQPVPFSKLIDMPQAADNPNIEISCYLEQIKAELRGESELSFSALVILDISVTAQQEQAVLTNLTMGEEQTDELPQMALCFLQPGETLWDVGKRYRVRPESMEAMGDRMLIVVK